MERTWSKDKGHSRGWAARCREQNRRRRGGGTGVPIVRRATNASSFKMHQEQQDRESRGWGAKPESCHAPKEQQPGPSTAGPFLARDFIISFFAFLFLHPRKRRWRQRFIWRAGATRPLGTWAWKGGGGGKDTLPVTCQTGSVRKPKANNTLLQNGFLRWAGLIA